ncbi:MAG: carboxypeptidase-like regulatory domain-containing protein [Acidobacteriota bacterium]|jgi:hypothetical protein
MPGGEVFLIGAIVGLIILLLVLALFMGGAVWALSEGENAAAIYGLTVFFVVLGNMAAFKSMGWTMWLRPWSPWVSVLTALTVWTVVVAPLVRWGRHRASRAAQQRSWTRASRARIKVIAGVGVLVALALFIANMRDSSSSFISGRVVDQAGRPVPGIEVGLLDKSFDWYGGHGEPTDADGCYEIGPLAPGRWYLAARPSAPVYGLTPPAGEGLGWAFTFYPDAMTPQGARMVEFAEGEDPSGMDLTIAKVRWPRVSGILTMPDGEPATGGRVSLYGEGWYHPQAGDVGSDGRFTFAALPPGSYHLTVSTRYTDQENRDCAGLPLTVVQEDIEGIHLASAPLARIRGRVAGPELPTMTPLPEVVANIDGPIELSALGTGGALRGDGTFNIASQCGPARLTMEGLPPGWTVERILLDERDITDASVDFSSEPADRGVVVVLASNAPRLDVRLLHPATGAPVGGTVLVFAADRSRWVCGSRFSAHDWAPPEGISFTNLPPADYYVVGLGLMSPSVYRLGVLDYLSTVATPVRLEAGQSTEITVSWR